MLSKKYKKNSITTSNDEIKPNPKKRRIKQPKSNYGTEMELALAISKSLHDAEQEEKFELGLISPSELLSTVSSKIEKNSSSHWFNKNKATNDAVVTKFKRNALKIKTALQTSTIDIRDRVLTTNISKILIQNDGCENENCLTKNLDAIKLVNVLWNHTTYYNERTENFSFINKLIYPKNKLHETLSKENSTNNICLKKNPLENESETEFDEINTKLWEKEINDDGNLKILMNLISLCPINEEIHDNLKGIEFIQEESRESNSLELELNENQQTDNNFNTEDIINIEDDTDRSSNDSNIDICEKKDNFIRNDIINREESSDSSSMDFDFFICDKKNNSSSPRDLKSKENSNFDVDEIINLDEDNDNSSFDLDNAFCDKKYNIEKNNITSFTDFNNTHNVEKTNLNEDKIENHYDSSSMDLDISYGEKDKNLKKNEIINLEANSDSSSMEFDLSFCEKGNNLNENKIVNRDSSSDDLNIAICEKTDNCSANEIVNIEEDSSRSSFCFDNMILDKEYQVNLNKDEVINIESNCDSSSMDLDISCCGKENNFIKNEIRNVDNDISFVEYFSKNNDSQDSNKVIKQKLKPLVTQELEANFSKSSEERDCNNSQSNTSKINSTKLAKKTSSSEKNKPKNNSQKCDEVNRSGVSLQKTKTINNFFQNNNEILTKILKYQPISLNCLKEQLRKEKIKYKKDELLKYLDEQGVTVCMES
ncbi:uncharacterized protein MAL13P1.304-like [Leptopilina heterotoma]|uniref:uncharacterized protein MAL13P1.304-like n=1 Tax=Leptopilina heterotoma TaxID=63436 RepID=UPI001CA9FE50|nr:uncharacterized protein MAL13P1.304-like [Leptopilina heterotoma]XP_043478319.1 uncharacterized protein MAL13P1.304-like [Leptopilina heterotoma]